MELLRGTAPKARFDEPTPDTEISMVTYSVNGASAVSVEATPVDGGFEIQLPYIGSDTNDVEVVWSFTIEGISETFEEIFSYEAVTPYLTSREVKQIFPQASDQEAADVEAGVRHIINAYTGQSFGFDRSKTITVEGHGESVLRLPERLVELQGISTLTSVLNPAGAIVVSDGWYLKKAWLEEISIQDSNNQYWGDWRDGVFDNNIYSDPDGDGRPPIVGPLGSRPGGIIVAPGTSGGTTPWKNDYPFEITGDWGYKTIPAEVKEAAKLLVNDYACMEIAYRDRYLESIKAADWRLQFSAQAWEATGNVRADQLLSEYVILDWAVI